MNKVLLLGRLGQDPELKYTQGGQALLKIRMATSDRYKDKAGAWQERTEWHTVTVWGARGEALAKIMTKGMQVFVEGRISTRSWEDKEGNKRFMTEIHADDVVLFSPPKNGEQTREAPPKREPPPQRGAPSDPAPTDDTDGVPF